MRLPTGVVSNEANEAFTRLECRVAADNNFISLIKKIRPSLSRHKGVIDLNKLFVVEQNGNKAIYYKKDDTNTAVLTSGTISKTANDKRKWHSSSEQQFFKDLDFVQKTNENELLESTSFKIDADNVEADEIVVGIYDQHLYVFTNKPIDKERIFVLMQAIHNAKMSGDIQKAENSDCGLVNTRFSPVIDLCNGLEWWFYAKIAFNVLAQVKGKDFALDIGFDNFRESVIEWRERTSDGTSNISVKKWELFSDVFNDISTNWAYILFTGGNVKIHVSLLGLQPRGYDIGTHTQEKIDGHALCFELNGNFEVLCNDEAIDFIALKKHPEMMKQFLLYGDKNSKLSRIISKGV